MIFGAARPRAPRNSTRAARRPPPGVQEPLPPKLIPALRALFSTGASLLHTRLSLAGIELEEEMQRLMSAAVLGVVAMVFALLGIIVGTFTIVAAVPPEYRVATMIGITVLYFAIAVVAILRVKGIFTNRPPIFSATLAELEKDKETWSQINRAHRDSEEARERADANRAASSSTTAQGVL